MRILGIDPGLAIVGWAVVDAERGQIHTVAYGAITTPAHTDIERRLVMIEDDLSTLLDKYRPDEAAVEELFFTNNITTGIPVAEARGVTLATLFRHRVKINEYTPMQVKQAVVGYGKAEKRQVIAMVTSILKLKEPPKPDDTADACAIAICHANCAGSAIGQFYNKR